MTADIVHTGACMCGAVRFEAHGTPKLRYFAPSPGLRRGFCGECGSTLSYGGERWPTEIHFHAGAFDRPEDFPPTGHAFKEERLARLHVDDL